MIPSSSHSPPVHHHYEQRDKVLEGEAGPPRGSGRRETPIDHAKEDAIRKQHFGKSSQIYSRSILLRSAENKSNNDNNKLNTKDNLDWLALIRQLKFGAERFDRAVALRTARKGSGEDANDTDILSAEEAAEWKEIGDERPLAIAAGHLELAIPPNVVNDFRTAGWRLYVDVVWLAALTRAEERLREKGCGEVSLAKLRNGEYAS